MMKNAFLFWMATLFIASAADFHVAPPGATGRQPSFDSLEAARDAARKAGAGPHRIVVLPGDYFLAKTVELDARDNGLTIEAAKPGKVTIYGGKLVTGWRRDSEKFWCADVPATWDFRALVVNGRMPERARLPETGTFIHQSKFDVRWLSSVGGGWERKPTEEELTTMLYDPKDIPSTFECKNAEVRVYHMWDESLVGVARNDTERHALTFAPPTRSPPGAFGVKKYVIFNTREGMTKPGQWYLDRAAGKVVYWPLPSEDMTKAKVVAPALERIIKITGATNITLRGFSLQATTTPLKPGGFGAYAFDGALQIEKARQCVFEKLDIANVGGQGIVARLVEDCRISDCQIHHTGACGIKADGSATQIARNHIHHVGVYHPSAVALSVTHPMKPGSEKGFHLYRNEIHDTPYSGIIGSGGGHLIEENLISRVMREMHDGGAIYGGMRNSILRGNVVRDVVKIGEGYGVSSYYLDEGARDCIVERNVSIGVERPTHNHIATDLIIRDNVFVAETIMVLSFQRSSGCIFQGNTLVAPGTITLSPPSAVKLWTNNVVFYDGVNKPFTIADVLPPTPPPARKTTPVSVARIAQPPTLDGEINWNEWPNTSVSLDRSPSRWPASGAPAFCKLAYDDQCLYVAVNIAMFDVTKLSSGAKWGKDDGAEVCIAVKEGTFVIHGFADGTVESVTLAGVPADAAARVGKAVRFAAKPYGTTRGGWRCEWAIPFDALGLKPTPGLKVPFNIGVRRTEDNVWRCIEGTLAQNWRLDQAATLQLK
ncbi:MAG: hypothetical protein FJ395_20260 [Verrucomicrobia bacterium]|nr:hypothetical protein [Verrucomicrobiota bacterium]